MTKKNPFRRALVLSIEIIVIGAVLLFLQAYISTMPQPKNGLAAPFQQPGYWDLIFNDEFEGNVLDPNKWVTCYWWVEKENGCSISSNDELEWYMPDNVKVEGGKLLLTAERENVRSLAGKAYPYSSGMITTGRNTDDLEVPIQFAFQYGYLEVRARIPKGQGLWPAIWMLPADQLSKPEIDLMEILGHETNVVHMNFHYKDATDESQQSSGEWTSPVDLAGGWHTYAVKWEPDKVTWYIDGIERRVLDDKALVPSEPMYLILNLAVGGNYPGSPDDNTVFPSTFEIDYVRVWKNSGTVILPPTADTFTNSSKPNENFANDRWLAVGTRPARMTFLKYDLAPLERKTIKAAWLRVKVAATSDGGSAGEQTVHLVKEDRWDEARLVYVNQPEIDPKILGTISDTEPNIHYDIPLDPAVIQAYTGDTLSLALQAVEGDNLILHSRRFQSIFPRLLIVTADEPSAGEFFGLKVFGNGIR